MGPSSMIAKLGEYGAVLASRDGFFALPAYPLEKVVDPTGAGDTFAGGICGLHRIPTRAPGRSRPAVHGDGIRHRRRIFQR